MMFNHLLIRTIFGALVIGHFSLGLSHAQDVSIVVSNNLQSQPVDSLDACLSRVNEIWQQQQGDLDLAGQLLQRVTQANAKQYYEMASRFYFWSLGKATFSADKKAIAEETHRLMPLVKDITKRRWQNYLDENDPRLMAEIAGFWEQRDLYLSTDLNERLIEHWQRIDYAKAHFNRGNTTPYGTDDRGTIWVRFGRPQIKLDDKHIFIRRIPDPYGTTTWEIQLGEEIDVTFDLWRYISKEGKDHYYIFGAEDGNGSYGLQDGIYDIFNFKNKPLALPPGSGGSASLSILGGSKKQLEEAVIQYGFFRKVAALDPHFQEIYRQIEERMFATATNIGSSANKDVGRAVTGFKSQEIIETRHQMAQAPENESQLVAQNSVLKVEQNVFRFLDKKNIPQYALAIQLPAEQTIVPDSAFHVSPDGQASYYLDNYIFGYDGSWNKVAKTSDPIALNDSSRSVAALYMLPGKLRNYHIYTGSEILNPSYSGLKLPGKPTPESSTIIATTGKQLLNFPPPIHPQKKLAISDIIIGADQQPAYNHRIPLTPDLNYTFKEGSTLMIYFEAYNVPEGGYSFSYFFKKDRTIFRDKKVDNRSEITVLADQTRQRDSQLFSIQLDNLTPGPYKLVLRFAPLEKPTEIIAFEKEINIKIIE